MVSPRDPKSDPEGVKSGPGEDFAAGEPQERPGRGPRSRQEPLQNRAKPALAAGEPQEHPGRAGATPEGLLEAILDDSGRQINDFGSKMGSKSIQNESKMAPKRIPDRVFDSELVFQSIFIDF